jgi:hypothetical protein
MTHEIDQGAVARLAAEQACIRLCHLYCRALDRADAPLLRSLFHPDASHRHADFIGTAAEFCDYALAVVQTFEATHHQLGQSLIEVDGDLAFGETYFTAHHRAGAGTVGAFPAHDPAIAEDVAIGGRYLDRFEYRDGEWKIARRHGVHDWERWSPASDRMLVPISPGGRGTRDAIDALTTIRSPAA